MDPLLGRLLPPQGTRQRRTVLLLAAVVALLVLGGAVLVSSLSAAGSSATLPTVQVQRTAAPAPTPLLVQVVGAVRRPGLVSVPAGARAIDAIAAAGGATDRADESAVNLAAPVADGQQLAVPVRGAATPVASAGASAAAGSGAKVGLASATAEQLETLPRIGPELAARILAYRAAHGGFHSVTELQQVGGIGPKTFAGLKGSGGAVTAWLARSGLLVPAVCAELAAAAAVALPGTAGPGLAVCGLLLPATVLLALRRRRDRRRVVAVAAALATAAVLAAVLLGDAARHPPGLPVGRAVTAEVRIETVARVAANDRSGTLTGRSVVHGVLLRWRSGAQGGDASAPVTLFGDGSVRAAAGAMLRLDVVLRRAPPTDTAAYLGSVLGAPRPIAPPDPVQTVADGLRRGFAARAARLPGDGGALLPGLAIGDTNGVGTALNQAMRNASLSHLTAVSGANCAVVIAGVLALTGLAGLRRPLRLLLAALALGGFVVLVTPQPSVVRAATMAAIVLGCLATGRRAAGVPVLSLAVTGLLVADPWLAWSAGFVLSVLATGGLLLLTRPIAAVLQRVLPARLALLVAVPIAAQVACQPVLILLQPAVPVAGVLANLLAEPAAPVATLLGLIACLLGPVVPPLADGLTLLAWVPAAWIAQVARVAGDLPQVPWIAGAPGALLAAGLVALAATAAIRVVPARVRLAALVLLLGLGVALAGSTAGTAVARVAALPRDWEIAACDVGQGDGLVLNGGGGHVAVIDTGRQPGPITGCLARLGIGHIDLLVLTHWDADHVGAAASLAGRVGTVFIGPTDRSAAVLVQSALAKGGARILQVHRGETARVGRLRLDVLWPPDPLNGIEPGNPASITVLVHGSLTSIFTGDLGEDAQNALLAAGPVPRVDVVKVAHHGSADQSPAFYTAVGATLGLVSVGLDNDYGHPTRRLLGILRSTGTTPVRTDQNGLVLVSSGSVGRVTVWTERPRTDAVWVPAK